MFKPKLPNQDQGFTLIEVLIAILIATIFVTVAMQMMVIATVFKVRAQEFSEATNWIQEDLEDVKFQASQYSDTSKCSVLTSDDGFADGFRDLLTEPIPKTFRNGKQFNLTRTTTPFSIAPGTAPYDVLQVSYDVSPTSGGSSIAKFYTEVIPNGALQCP